MKIKYQRKRLIALLTALSISLGVSGCHSSNKCFTNNISVETDDLQTPSPSPTLSSNKIEYLENLELQKLVDDYLEYFSSVKVSYPYEDLYPSKRKIDKILSRDKTYCEYEHQDTITVNELFRMIKKNSIQYAKKHPKFRTAFESSGLQDRDLIPSRYLKFYLWETLTEMKKKSSNDFLEDICKMKDLKIVFGDLNSSPQFSVCGEYNYKSNRIVLDPVAIKNMPKKSKYDVKPDVYQDVLEHELYHLRSVACKHRMEKGQKFREILGDSFVTTIKESSAESSIYTMAENVSRDVDSNDFMYPEEREDESLILLLGLFHDNKTYDDYYNAIMDSNPEAFYDFCGAKNTEERHNLYKILAAIDGKNGRNNIVYTIKKSDEISLADGEKKIRYNYKLDIFHKVLSNMIDYTSTHPEFTIEKNVEILNIIEDCILDYNTFLNQNNSYDQSFILDIYQSETKYLDFLAEYYFKGEGKDHSFIRSHYQRKIYNPDEVIRYDNEWWASEFPLLKPILFVHDTASYNREVFLKRNKEFIKQNCQKH